MKVLNCFNHAYAYDTSIEKAMVAILQYEQVMLHIIAGLSMLDRDEVAWSCLLSPLVTSHIVFAARQGVGSQSMGLRRLVIIVAAAAVISIAVDSSETKPSSLEAGCTLLLHSST